MIGKIIVSALAAAGFFLFLLVCAALWGATEDKGAFFFGVMVFAAGTCSAYALIYGAGG